MPPLGFWVRQPRISCPSTAVSLPTFACCLSFLTSPSLLLLEMNILGGDGRGRVQGWAQIVALDRGKGGFFIVGNLELRFEFFRNHALGFLSAGAEDFAGHLKACQVTQPEAVGILQLVHFWFVLQLIHRMTTTEHQKNNSLLTGFSLPQYTTLTIP